MLAQEQSAQVTPSGQTWQELVDARKLDICAPEDIAAAIRRMGDSHGGQLRGKLLDHLRELAESYLIPRVDKNLPDQGRGAVKATVDGMVDALLLEGAADGVGYETNYLKRLRQRLVDQIRRVRSEQRRFEEPAPDPESGEFPEPSHPIEELTPEEAAIAAGILASLSERHRKALSLYRAGYRCSDAQGGETIASMMSVSVRTAEQWMRDIRKAVAKHLDLKP
ncbi:RNA polymerase sigma factor [Methylorubrum thiocyanatum]|uniref:RNA polymerase sigma factor n=1 Tax=Methylorubrum thiocyanatum TaxID=47958 RepID=UPI00398C6CF4